MIPATPRSFHTLFFGEVALSRIVENGDMPLDDGGVEDPQVDVSDPQADDSESLICPSCGYNLRAIASDKCPECGLSIDRESMSVSRIPWEHRSELGVFRAYWRTTRMVMLHPRQFAGEMNRPAAYHNARQFQFI